MNPYTPAQIKAAPAESLISMYRDTRAARFARRMASDWGENADELHAYMTACEAFEAAFFGAAAALLAAWGVDARTEAQSARRLLNGF